MFSSFRYLLCHSLLMFLILWNLFSCTIYRSDGRKTFESKNPVGMAISTGLAKINSESQNQMQNFNNQGCEIMSELKLDFQSSFLGGPKELLWANEKHEIWKKVNSDDSIQISVIENLGSQYSVCNYTFSSSLEWNQASSYFFQTID